MYYDIFKEVVNVNPVIAVTITMDLNVSPKAKSNHDKIVLKNLVKEAINRLESMTDKKTTGQIVDKLNDFMIDVPVSFDASGLVIFVSEDYIKSVFLSFHPGNDVKIKSRFATRTLIRSMQRTEHYYILVIAKDNARLFEASNDYHIDEICDDVFPLANEIFYPVGNLDKSYANDTYTREYFNDVNRNLDAYYKAAPLPIIIVGTTENLPILHEILSKNRNVIGSVQGAFNRPDHEPLRELLLLAAKEVESYVENQLIESMSEIAKAQENDLVESSITLIYKFAKNGQIRKLYLNEDYHHPSKFDDKGNVIELEKAGDEEAEYDDIVSEIIYQVMSFGGEVIFLPPYSLDRTQQVVAILRWV